MNTIKLPLPNLRAVKHPKSERQWVWECGFYNELLYPIADTLSYYALNWKVPVCQLSIDHERNVEIIGKMT